MSVQRYFIVAVGLVILGEGVAFGGGKDQVAAQVAQPTEYHSDYKFAGLISRPGKTQEGRKARTGKKPEEGQDKSRIGRSASPSPAIAPESGAVSRPDLHASDLQDSVCLMIEAAGRAHDLPPEFFVRVIWQESRFRPDTVGPRRRNGESAQGIAQFMPSTAAERGLLDPFDPVQALPKAAQFLRELKDQFGNLGLAAAAYNAGPARVRAWLAGARQLSVETRNYVVAITGVPADEWAKAYTRKPAVKTSPNCGELMAQAPASPQGPPPPSHDEPVQSHNTELAKNDAVALGSVRGDLGTPYQEAPSSRGDTSLFVERLTERVKLVADSPWGIQLSAGFSRERVLAAYVTIASRYAEILAGRHVSILSSVFRSRGTGAFYQIRVGTDTLESADNLCAEIRRAGGACMVLRNRS
jgi:hypothetical protein